MQAQSIFVSPRYLSLNINPNLAENRNLITLSYRDQKRERNKGEAQRKTGEKEKRERKWGDRHENEGRGGDK